MKRFSLFSISACFLLAVPMPVPADESPGVLGLRLDPIPQGMLVGDVAPEGAAAGRIFALDGITEVNGRPVPSTVEEAASVIRGPLGSEVRLTVIRRCSRLIPPVSIPMTLTRGKVPYHNSAEVLSDAEYLWQLGRITRQHIIDTSYAEYPNDRHSVRWHLQRLMALEASVEDLGSRSVVTPPLRKSAREAMRYDTAVCAMMDVWDGIRDTNLQQLQRTGERLGFNLFTSSKDGVDGPLQRLAAGVIGRSIAQIQSHAIYQKLRSDENPHAQWRALARSGRFESLPLSPGPFTYQDNHFMWDPHWQFIRRNDLPFDQYPGLGNDIVNFPETVSRMSISLGSGGYAKLQIRNLAGDGRWRLTVNVPSPAKYFFVMVQTDKGILGLTQNPGGYCTWASKYDAFYANNGLIGRETRSYSGNFDFSIVHRNLPMLGEEGGASSGTIYFWTSDDPAFPDALWKAAPTASLH